MKCSENEWMQQSMIWFSGHGGIQLNTGLDDLGAFLPTIMFLWFSLGPLAMHFFCSLILNGGMGWT